MKSLHLLVLVIAYVSQVDADLYIQNPRGSNNRMNEKTATRANGNRVFDSQNNARGGYNIGDLTAEAAESSDGQYLMHYFMSPVDPSKGESVMPIEWTNQHGCGANEDDDPNKLNCNIVLQMMCAPHDADEALGKFRMRDGFSTQTNEYHEGEKDEETYQEFLQRKEKVQDDRAYHEPFEWYDKCTKRHRNHGLFTADQDLKGESAKYTRQNPKGTRRGYECPEERDYFPYWHPTPWKDIKVLAERADRCAFYQEHSFNVKSKFECVEKWSDGKTKHYSWHNNKKSCESADGVWTEFHNYLEILHDEDTSDKCKQKNATPGFQNKLMWGRPLFHDTEKCLVKLDAPECEVSPFSRVNHLGNGVNLEALRIKWKVPAFPSGDKQKCILRMRYNISTDDYNVENATNGIPIRTFTDKAETKMLGQWGPPPKEIPDGKFYLGTADKFPYKAGEYVTYEKTSNGQKSWQWFGWQSDDFSDKFISFEFSIYFEGSVPPKSGNFGMKVYGKVYNSWLRKCKPNKWCYVEKTVKVATSGDAEHVILIFDSIKTQGTKIHFADFSVTIFELTDLIEENPTVDVGAIGQGLKLAINTAQFGRTFQDRTHINILEEKEEIFNGPTPKTLQTIQVRGKRGNIVQTFPAVEYDFIPTNTNATTNDMIYFTWTGSNTHNNGGNGGDGQAGNDGQGNEGTDRSNVCAMGTRDQSFPLTFDDARNLCQHIKKIVWSSYPIDTTDTQRAREDACIQLMSSGFFGCLRESSTCGDALLPDGKDMDPILNNVSPTFKGIILEFEPGCFHFFSTRNNAFTNRAQKATICVTP